MMMLRHPFFLFVACLALLLGACDQGNAGQGEQASLHPGKNIPALPYNTKTVQTPNDEQMVGLASPVKLQPDTTHILLGDYFLHPELVDSVACSKFFTYHLTKDQQVLTLFRNVNLPLPLVDVLKLYVRGKEYVLVLLKSQKVKHVLTFDPKGKSYQKVQVASTLNDWNPGKSNMIKKGGQWQIELNLHPGTYQYQLVADGKWMLDPANPDSADNNIGGFNSVLKVTSELPAGRLSHVFPFEEHEGGKIGFRFRAEVGGIFFLWQNQLLPSPEISRELLQMILTIPEEAKQYERSFIRAYHFNARGPGNDVLIPLEYGKPIFDPAKITRQDRQANILYFMLVDRFNNGNPKNDDPVKDPEVDEKANYWGGDLAGITAKIKDGYFQDLGVNTIWISPIIQNPLKAYVEYPAPHKKYSGYHGYWPISSSKVDHRFGTSKELKALIQSSHKEGMNVLLDFVANHVHEDHPMIKAHPDWATPLVLPDGTKNIRIWDEHRLTTWFDTFLPSLDFSKREVIDTQVDSALYWMQQYELDGFRHDATKHIPETFWRELTRELKQEIILKNGRPVYQIGETFGSRELIASYVGSGQMDAQFDFNLYFDARSVFALDSESFQKLDESLRSSLDWYGHHHLMGNITGNHDIARFISFAGGGLRFDEDDKAAGWERDIQVEDPMGYTKLSNLTAFLMTIPGLPVIYYGDELGMPGGGDPDNRRPMKFDGLSEKEQQTKAMARQLIQMRRSNMPLLYGDLIVVDVTDDTYVYQRSWFDQITLVAFNKSDSVKNLSLQLPWILRDTDYEPHFGSTASLDKNVLNLTLAPHSFEILTSKKIAPPPPTEPKEQEQK